MEKFERSNLIEYLVKKTKAYIISIDDYSSGKKEDHIKNRKIKYGLIQLMVCILILTKKNRIDRWFWRVFEEFIKKIK